MNSAYNLLEHQSDRELSQNQIRDMVLESYIDIPDGSGQECNLFFDELEKRYTSH